MKYKVITKSYVEAPSWEEAERRVEQMLVQPDEIESEPASRAPRDLVMFGLSSKIFDEHNKIFFTNEEIDSSYEYKMHKLRKETMIWLEAILEDIIRSNEEDWV